MESHYCGSTATLILTITLYLSLGHLVSCRLLAGSCHIQFQVTSLPADGLMLHTANLFGQLPHPWRATPLTWLRVGKGTSQHKTQMCYWNESFHLTVSLHDKILLPTHSWDDKTQNSWLRSHGIAISLMSPAVKTNFPKILSGKIQILKSTEWNCLSGCCWTLCSSLLLEKS